MTTPAEQAARRLKIRFEVYENETLKIGFAPEVEVWLGEDHRWVVSWMNEAGHEFRGTGDMLDLAILDFLRDRLGLNP